VLQRPDGGYNITTCHDFHPEKPHSFFKGILWKVLLKFVHYVVCLPFFLISFFGITVIITWHDQLLLSSANLVEIHFLGLQTRVLHLMPAALRMLTAAAADPVGTCFVTGTTTRMTAVAHTEKQSWNQMHYLKREFQEVLSYF